MFKFSFFFYQNVCIRNANFAFYFEKKNGFLKKIWIFEQNSNLWKQFEFRLLTKISRFEQNFDFG